MKTMILAILLALTAFSILIVTLKSFVDSSEIGLQVSIISVEEGERVHGKISFHARVNRPEDVDYVEFYIQEPGAEDRYSWKDYAVPYYWGGDGYMLDTAVFDDGPASVVAFCYPKDKSRPMVQHRVRFVIENGKPAVMISEPDNNAVVSGIVPVRVEAKDLIGREERAGISHVIIEVDGSPKLKLTRPPFKTDLNTCMMRPGLHSIRAVAEDYEGFISSKLITIHVADKLGEFSEGKSDKR